MALINRLGGSTWWNGWLSVLDGVALNAWNTQQQNKTSIPYMVRGKKIETFFENRSSNRWLLSLYGVKEETIFIFNLTIRSFRSLYGAKKIFHSIFGRNGSVWGVRAWKEKQSFFIINLANRYLLSLYGAWKEVKIFLFQLSKWTFAVQIVVKKGKSFEF